MEFEVGELVRVILDDETSRRALITDKIDEIEKKYEIVYYDNTEDDDDEEVFPLNRIQKAYNFEKDKNAIIIATAEELKDCGNMMFKIKDFIAAIEYYRKALKKVCPYSINTGTSIMICESNSSSNSSSSLNTELHLHVGHVGLILFEDDNDNNVKNKKFSIDIDEICGGVELSHVAVENLVCIPTTNNDCLLLRAIYLNLARVHYSLQLYGWSARYAGIAYQLCRFAIQFHNDNNTATSY